MKKIRAHILFLLVLLLFSSSRIINLDADAPLTNWLASIGEEALWGAPARNQVLFGGWQQDEYTSQHIAMSPLYSAMLTVVFKQFGVGLSQLRLLSVIFSTLLAVLLYLFISRESRSVALLAAFFLLLNDSFFSFNRLGLVETTLTFFVTLAAVVSMLAKDNKALIFLSGALFCTAVFVKLYGAWFIMPLLGIYCVNVARKSIKNSLKNHLLNAASFVAGALVVFLAIAALFYVPNMQHAVYGLVAEASSVRSEILILENLFNLIINPFFASLSIGLLFIFSTHFLLRLSRKNILSLPEYQLFGIVLFFGIFAASLSSTFADRRFVPLTVPLAILAASCFTSRKPEAGAPRNTAIKAIAIALLVSVLAQQALFEIFGFKNYNAVAILLFVVLSAILILIRHAASRHLDYFRIVLLIASFILFAEFFKTITFNFFAQSSFVLPVLLASLLSLVVYAFVYGKRLFVALLAIYILFNAAVIGTAIFYPSYSIRDASLGMAGIAGDKIVTGPSAYQFSYEGNYKPMWYSPRHWNPRYVKINKDSAGDFNYLLARSDYADKNYIYPRPAEVNSTYIQTFQILGGRATFYLYEIN